MCCNRVTPVDAQDIEAVHSNINEHFWRCSDSLILLSKHGELVILSKTAACVRQIQQMVLPGEVYITIWRWEARLSENGILLLLQASCAVPASWQISMPNDLSLWSSAKEQQGHCKQHFRSTVIMQLKPVAWHAI